MEPKFWRSDKFKKFISQVRSGGTPAPVQSNIQSQSVSAVQPRKQNVPDAVINRMMGERNQKFPVQPTGSNKPWQPGNIFPQSAQIRQPKPKAVSAKPWQPPDMFRNDKPTPATVVQDYQTNAMRRKQVESFDPNAQPQQPYKKYVTPWNMQADRLQTIVSEHPELGVDSANYRYPTLDRDVHDGAFIFYDPDNNQITTKETDFRYYLDGNNNLTLDSGSTTKPNRHAIFTEKVYNDIRSEIDGLVETFSTEVERLNNPVTMKKLTGEDILDLRKPDMYREVLDDPFMATYIDNSMYRKDDSEPEIVTASMRPAEGKGMFWGKVAFLFSDLFSRIARGASGQAREISANVQWNPEYRDVVKGIAMWNNKTPDGYKEWVYSLDTDPEKHSWEYINWVSSMKDDIEQGKPIVDTMDGEDAWKRIAISAKMTVATYGTMISFLANLWGRGIVGAGRADNQIETWLRSSSANDPYTSGILDALGEYVVPDGLKFNDPEDFVEYKNQFQKMMSPQGDETVMQTDLYSDMQKAGVIANGYNELALVDLASLSLEELEGVVDKIVGLQKIEATIGATNIYAFYTGMTDYDSYEKFHYLVAQYRVQKAERTGDFRLTPAEIDQLKDHVSDPATEFFGSLVNDPTNFLNIKASKVFSQPQLLRIQELTGVTNVMERQIDGLIRASVLSSAAKYVGAPVGKWLRTFEKIDDFVGRRLSNAAFYEGGGIIPRTSRYIKKLIGHDTTDYFNDLFGGPSKVLSTAPQDLIDEVDRMALHISELAEQGRKLPEIVEIVQSGKAFSPILSSKKKIEHLYRMLYITDTMSDPKGLMPILMGAYEKSLEDGSRVYQNAFFGSIDFGDLTRRTPFPEVNRILDDIVQLPADQQMKELGVRVVELAKQSAGSNLTSDQLSRTIANRFAEAFGESRSHKALNHGNRTVRLYNDTFLGIIDNGLAKSKSGLANHLRQGISSIKSINDAIQAMWINNIISRKPAWFGVQQPIEQYSNYLLSGVGFEDAADYFTPEVVRNLDSIPAAGRAGFASAIEVSDTLDSVRYAKGLREFMEANPNAWLPTPGSYTLYFNKSVRESYMDSLNKLWANHAGDKVDDIVERNMFFRQIAESTDSPWAFGNVVLPDGKEVTTFRGKVFDVPAAAKRWWKATGDAGGDLGSMNEMMTRAKVSYRKFHRDFDLISDRLFDQMSAQSKLDMVSSGVPENIADDIVDNLRRMWDASDGDAKKFIESVNINATGNTPSVFSVIPDAIKDMPIAMDVQDSALFYRKTKDELNLYITGLFATNQPITEETLSPFFDTFLDNLRMESMEKINPLGFHGYNIFGVDLVKRPVSASTAELLEAIDNETLETLGYVTRGADDFDFSFEDKLKNVLSDNGINIEGKTVTQALAELQEEVRPDWWVPPNIRKEAVERALNSMDIPDATKYSTLSYELAALQKKYGDDFTRALQEYPAEILADDYMDYAHEVKELRRLAAGNRDIDFAIDRYRSAVGPLYGIRDNLRTLAIQNPDDAVRINEVVDLISNIIKEDQTINIRARMVLENVVPGHVVAKGTAKGVGTDAVKAYNKSGLPHEGFEFVNDAATNSLNKRAEYFEEMYKAAVEGRPIPILNHKTALNFWGIDFDYDSTGRVIAYKIADPENPGGLAFVITEADRPEMFRQISDPYIHLGHLNRDFLESGLDVPRSVLKDRLNSTAPIRPPLFNIPQELVPEHRISLLRAYLSQPAFDNKSLWFYINPYMSGRQLENVTLEEILSTLKTAASKNDGEAKRVIEGLIDHVESVDSYFYNNMLVSSNVRAGMPNFPNLMPDDMRAFTELRLRNVSQMAGIESIFDVWKRSLIEQNDAGLLKLRPVVADQYLPQVNNAMRTFADGAVNAEEVLWRGGELVGIPFEGAIPFMEKNMRVSSENVVDQFAKGIVPFWNYATRGTTMWARFMMERPQIVRLYQQYMLLGRRQAIRGGFTNSVGQPLPSTQGNMRIPGTNIWFSPMNILSPAFAYFFRKEATNQYDDEPLADIDSVTKFTKFMRTFGVRLGPVADIAMTAWASRSGEVDEYTTQTAGEKLAWYGISSLVPSDFIPPFVWNAVEDALGYEQTGSFNPQVEWFDALVEQRLYEDLLYDLRTTLRDAPEVDRIKAVNAVKDIIMLREKSPTYKKYVRDIQGGNYAKSMMGYFTGIYPKWYTPGAIEVYALRDELNLLRESVNNEIAAKIFFPEMQPSELYDLWNDTRYETALGLMWDIRRNVSWVETDEGTPVTGLARREQINKGFEADARRNSYYAEQEVIYEWRDEQIRGLPVGIKYDDPAYVEIRNITTQRILNLQSDYQDVAPHWNPWSIRNKPQEMVDQIALNNIMRQIEMFKPEWNPDDGMTYPEYKVLLEKWRANIPNEAKRILPLILQQLTDRPIQIYNDQDVIGAINRAVEMATAESYDGWKKDNTSVSGAILDGYNTLFMNEYLDILYNMKNDARKTLAMQEWVQNNPKPTNDELFEWVMAEYGDRFTAEQVKEALLTEDEQPRDVLSIDDREARYATPRDTAKDTIYAMYGWLPQNRKSDFFNELNLLNSNSDFEVFMATGGNYPKDEEQLNRLLGEVQSVVNNLGISEPQGEALRRLANAQELNDEFVKMASMRLGENYADVISEYGGLTYQNKKTWKQNNPGKQVIVDEYYKLRDEFAKNNPLWEEYYMRQSVKSTTYYGYSGRGGGGRRSGRSGSSSVATAAGDIFTPAGMRSKRDVNTLLSPENLGKGGVAGMPKLPRDFWEKTTPDLRSEIYKYVNGESPLSQSGIAFLRRIITRYPEYSEEVVALIGEEDEG